MPVIAKIVKCKECGFEIRDDWHFCPNCGDRIICHMKIEEARKKTAEREAAKPKQ
jgi:hypothetical protein